MRIELDTDTCVGHGRCYSLSPEVFDSDDVGHGVVVVGEVSDPALIAAAERAEANCPEGAIRLVPDA